MNGIDVLSAPILLLLSVISFIIHFRNERRKSLIERPFFAASVDLKKKRKPRQRSLMLLRKTACSQTVLVNCAAIAR
ncbi:hypothetical protein [Serratia fonticola]|uniref:hypothetical protein n=1 Tax=Serratia fonticola TaxID=47917 RepID=UPI000463E42A|nr:hypothetical protein [Serratia fonticola]